MSGKRSYLKKWPQLCRRLMFNLELVLKSMNFICLFSLTVTVWRTGGSTCPLRVPLTCCIQASSKAPMAVTVLRLSCSASTRNLQGQPSLLWVLGGGGEKRKNTCYKQKSTMESSCVGYIWYHLPWQLLSFRGVNMTGFRTNKVDNNVWKPDRPALK